MDDFVSIWDHTYTLLDGKVSVLVHEDLDAGLGGTLFDGSVALSGYLEGLLRDEPEYFTGKDVLELGAGCGFPGLFVGKVGGKVVLTDLGPVVELLQENIELNKLEANTKAMSLNWLSDEDLRAITPHKFDYILAADTIYAEDAVEPFLNVCWELSSPSTQILFAHPRARVPAASERFWRMVRDRFSVEKVPASRFVKDWTPSCKQFLSETQGVFILRRRGDLPESVATQ